MTLTLLVNLAGIAIIAWIVWYFFLSRRSEVAFAAATAGGFQEIHVLVKGGYRPDVLQVEPGVPVRLHFRREETSACSEEIVFPDFGVKRTLPAFETTTIDLPPSAPGRYGFACGMDMLHGTLVVGTQASEPAPARPVADRATSCCQGGVSVSAAHEPDRSSPLSVPEQPRLQLRRAQPEPGQRGS